MTIFNRTPVALLLTLTFVAGCGGPDVVSDEIANHELATNEQALKVLRPAAAPTAAASVLHGALVASPNFPGTTGGASYVNTGHTIILRATVTTSALPAGALLCATVNGQSFGCSALASATGLPPYTAAFGLKTLVGAVGLSLQAGAVVAVDLGTPVGIFPAGWPVAQVTLQ